MTSPDTAAGIQDAARHLAEGRPAEAADALERLVRDFPSYVTAHVLLAKASEAAGDSERALEAWHAAHFLMPGSPLVNRERQRLLRIDVAPVEAAHEAPPSTGAAPSGEDDPDRQPVNEEPDREDTAADETVVSGTPEAWAVDADSAPEAEAAAPPLDPGETWQILEETDASRPAPPDAVEPTVAPPPGHSSRRSESASETPSSGGPASGRFVDDDLGAGFDPASAGNETAAHESDTHESGAANVDDLDALIEQLENAPRIRPDPAFKDEVAGDEEVDDSELVSETLARIYETQGQYAEAARAYARLAEQQPTRAPEFEEKAGEMRRRATHTGG